MKVAVLTLGCRSNQAESAQIEAGFRANGYSIVCLSERPDLCIINTCSVTSKSDYQSRQLIRRAHKSEARVIVTGCYAELNRDSVLSMDGVSAIVRNGDKLKIIDEITGKNVNAPSHSETGGRSRFTLKVQDGCNQSCSYCVIPKARGYSRSIPLENVALLAEEVSSLYNEIVLTGINLGTYGYDLIPKVTLSDLLRVLLSSTSITRIRLSSLEVSELTEDLIELLADTRICNHLHIPLQSGDDKILTTMNRNYDVRTFVSRIDHIATKIPDVSIGTDVIVGFPGEGEAGFLNTVTVLKSLPLTYFHIFPYSRRNGTQAAMMAGQVDESIKKERCALLLSLSNEKRSAYMTRQIGKLLDVLVEKRYEDGSFTGTAANYLKVRVIMENAGPKEIVNIKVAGHDGKYLIGVPIETS
ncbi:MAG TPA: tRNA (N(6)-L-threonylcarbamoyladenosine(37)-C(2))-methylthiotransferase MtaB [Thermodesulfovibrionales bacterium]|nr:tRNA (N(6)-L-threonylcarbamoyladenosine(37)-C(2))-methylthiotransferase MtaB [Thermodesulfovibrionales bacterium]